MIARNAHVLLTAPHTTPHITTREINRKTQNRGKIKLKLKLKQEKERSTYIEAHPSIVHSVSAVFGAAITQSDARQRLKPLFAADRHQKRVHTITLAVHNQPCKHHQIQARLSGCGDPPFGGGGRWGVQNEAVGFGVECGGSL
jgi:hypothetical protein